MINHSWVIEACRGSHVLGLCTVGKKIFGSLVDDDVKSQCSISITPHSTLRDNVVDREKVPCKAVVINH